MRRPPASARASLGQSFMLGLLYSMPVCALRTKGASKRRRGRTRARGHSVADPCLNTIIITLVYKRVQNQSIDTTFTMTNGFEEAESVFIRKIKDTIEKL